MKIDFRNQTIRELLEVSEWYCLKPDEYVKRVVERALDEAEQSNPQLDCWLDRYVKR